MPNFLPKTFNSQFPCVFARKLRVLIRLSSSLLPVTKNKGSIQGQILLSDLLPKSVNSHVFLPKTYDFQVLIRLSSVLLPVTFICYLETIPLIFSGLSPPLPLRYTMRPFQSADNPTYYLTQALCTVQYNLMKM